MNQLQPSRTAQEVAIYRAAHQLLDDPRIFDDPFALPMVGELTETSLRSQPQRIDPEIRAVIAMRSRYAEDELRRAEERGVRQYVILGAGLDTFAYRNKRAGSGPHVFEVDHSATQAWKQQRLRDAHVAIPDSLSFVALDFARQSLAEGLASAGFQPAKPAFFSMLGVVIFLPEKTVMEILEFVASLPTGSGIAFDYGMPNSSLTETQRRVREHAARQSAALGEPFVTFFDPPALANELSRMGFKHLDDFGYEQANARYFQNRADGLRVGISGRRMMGAHF